MKLIATVVALTMLVSWSTSSESGTVVSTIGDKDGFGIGVQADESFSPSALPGYDGPGDADGTDKWDYGSRSVIHSYTLPGSQIVSVSLEVFTGGQGYTLAGGGITNVYLNGVFIGALTDGDLDSSPNNYARKDIFDLTPYVANLSGTDTIYFQSPYSGDGWVLDYSELTITTVETPEELLLRLHANVIGVGPGKSLENRVELAQTYYAVPDIQATCAVLTEFVGQVTSWSTGKKPKLETDEAGLLIADAQVIMDAIGCN